MTKETRASRAGTKLTKADAELVKSAARHSDTPPLRLLSAASEVGDQPQMRALSAAVIAGGLLTGNLRLLRAGARMLVAHEAATLLKDLVKNRVNRTRPRSAGTQRERKVRPGSSTSKEVTSFPSGHSAGSLAVARAFAREYPELQAPALGAAGTIAAMQVPRSAHYPTDVAAGLLVGAIAEALSDLGWRAAGRGPGYRDDCSRGSPPLARPRAPVAEW